MSIKKIAIVLFLMFAIMPTYTTYAQTSNIKKIVGENTPDFIIKPIIAAINAIEKFRIDMGVVAEKKKAEIRVQIDVLNINRKDSTEFSPNSASQISNFSTSLKYVQLYFFIILSIIFNNQLIFYFSFAVIVFLVLRFIFNLIF